MSTIVIWTLMSTFLTYTWLKFLQITARPSYRQSTNPHACKSLLTARIFVHKQSKHPKIEQREELYWMLLNMVVTSITDDQFAWNSARVQISLTGKASKFSCYVLGTLETLASFLLNVRFLCCIVRRYSYSCMFSFFWFFWDWSTTNFERCPAPLTSSSLCSLSWTTMWL